MTFNVLLGLLGATSAAALAGAWLVFKHRTPAHWSFAAGMLLLAADTAMGSLAAAASGPETALAWQQGRVWCTAFLPAIWLVFSLCYSRGNGSEFLSRWRWAIVLMFLMPVLLVAGFGAQQTLGTAEPILGLSRFISLGWAGKAAQLTFLMGLLLVLVNLEKTFRSTVGLMRWRVKFFMLGLGVILGARVYASSQAVLFSGEQLSLVGVLGGSLLLGTLLMGFSLARTGLTEIDVYPSQALLFGSLAVLLAGIYLLAVGVFAEVVAWLGGSQTFLVNSLLLLLALVGLAVLFLSDRFRQWGRRFVNRHLRRPTYDYRRVWSALTERATSQLDQTALCTEVANLIAETFNVLSVSVWIVDGSRQRLQLGASTSLTGLDANTLAGSMSLKLGDDGTDLLAAVRANPDPLDMDAARVRWVEPLKRCNQDYFGKGGNRVCIPLVAGREVLGFVMLADRVNGAWFSSEDLDLLKCLGDQLAASLLNLRLSQQLIEAREFEAFQSMSAFFIHDLKNTASTLSMMLHNLPLHFQSAEFRADALRGIAKSVERINTLIGRLSLLRRGFAVHPVSMDLNELVTAAVRQLDGILGLQVHCELVALPEVPIDLEHFPKVLTNLLLNAREAVPEGGRIRVRTGQQDGHAWVSVTDNGPGMSADFVQRRLFRPFQTTKSKGLGIGLFQSKMIAEAHGGHIEAESELGKGTTFRVFLPLTPRRPLGGESLEAKRGYAWKTCAA